MVHRRRRNPISNNPEPPWWRARSAKILGVVIGPAAAGLVGAWFLWLAGPSHPTALAPPNPRDSVASSGSSSAPAAQPGADSGQPVIIEDVKALPWSYPSIVYPQKLILTTAQVRDLPFALVGSGFKLPTNGALTDEEWIQLTVAGNSVEPVTINDITIVKSCKAPLAGGTFIYSPFGAGAFPTSPVYFDLDSPVTLGQYLSIQTGQVVKGNFFARQVVTLQLHEPWTFAIFAQTSHHYCQFYFQMSVATTRGPVIETITDGGKPFLLTSDGELTRMPLFSSYAVVYVGTNDSQGNIQYFRVNPLTYHLPPPP